MTMMMTKMMMITMMTLGPLAVIPIDAAIRSCKLGWKYYKPNKLCVLVTSSLLNDVQARLTCRTNGSGMENSQVLVIADRNLNKWITETFPDEDVGINLIRASHSTEWRYLNGTKFNGYTNWLDGEPNLEHEEDSCVHIWEGHQGQWADAECSYEMKYLCQAEALDICVNETSCDQICDTSVDGFVKCKCMENYKMAKNGTCNAFDPCTIDNGGCSDNQMCEMSSPGNHTCQSKNESEEFSFPIGWIIIIIIILALLIIALLFMWRKDRKQEEADTGEGGSGPGAEQEANDGLNGEQE